MPEFHFYEGGTYMGMRSFDTRDAALAKVPRGWAIGAAPAPTPGTPDQVKREASRRIDAIADARERDHLMQRALRLVMKVTIEGEPLTAAEEAEIATESVLADRIEVVQAAERALLSMDPIPADYADAKWWP